MSPLRWDVLLVGFVLAVPVFTLGLRGDLSAEEVVNRLLWCLGAGWGAVALIRWAATPPAPARAGRRAHAGPARPAGGGDGEDGEDGEDEEPSPAS
jgi:hypothetical protein